MLLLVLQFSFPDESPCPSTKTTPCHLSSQSLAPPSQSCFQHRVHLSYDCTRYSSTIESCTANQSVGLGWGRFTSFVLQKRPYPALPIFGSDKLYTDKSSVLLDDLRVCLSTYLTACIKMLIRFFAPCVYLTWPWASSLLIYRHDQCALRCKSYLATLQVFLFSPPFPCTSVSLFQRFLRLPHPHR